MSIVDNKKAFFDYFIEERYEAGLVLEGWEVKAIRAGRITKKPSSTILLKNATKLGSSLRGGRLRPFVRVALRSKRLMSWCVMQRSF